MQKYSEHRFVIISYATVYW